MQEMQSPGRGKTPAVGWLSAVTDANTIQETHK